MKKDKVKNVWEWFHMETIHFNQYVCDNACLRLLCTTRRRCDVNSISAEPEINTNLASDLSTHHPTNDSLPHSTV